MTFIEPLESRIQFAGGTIDTTFGKNGVATYDPKTPLTGDLVSNESYFAQDTGGRIYVASVVESNDGATKKIVVSRLSRDGRLDANYGESGYKLLDENPTRTPLQVRLFVDQNNRAYIIDGSLLWRLSPGGKADATFGRKGKIVVPILSGATDQPPTAMAFDVHGRAYVGGSATGKKGTRMAIVRLTESGARDTTWAYQGIYKSPVNTLANTSSSKAFVQMMRFLPDGRLAVAGHYDRADIDYEYPDPQASYHPSWTTHAVWATRLNSDGNVDTTYGAGGYAENTMTDTDVDFTTDTALALTGDGTIIGKAGGFIVDAPDPATAGYGSNFRIHPDGKVQDAQLPIRTPTYDDSVFASGPLVVQSDGKIVDSDVDGLTRSNVDGSYDQSFGTQGVADVHMALIKDLQLAPDGSLIVRGTEQSTGEVVMRRLYREEGPAGQFDGRQISRPRSTATRFTVIWRDDDGVKQSSIDSSDIVVSGPFDGGSATRNAAIELVESLGKGRYRATYKLTSSGGWTAADNGIYNVKLVRNQVVDINGAAASARTLGTFRVKII